MMLEEDETLPTNSNISCKVCGEKQFKERDGFYYCQECGTKQDQIRHIEFEHDDDNKKAKKQIIKAVKTEKLQLTSWECYNYILRGFVQELLSFGAKDELKLMTLQVWAAYLRRTEVAFFNKKHAVLPKLGIIYLKNDAETIYNHSRAARKKRKSKRGEGDTSGTGTSGNESMSARSYRKSKRKLDESIYSLTSASEETGLTSSTSTNSNKAIKLNYNTSARKYYKKKMPIKHLKKHEIDAEGLLKCHKQPKTREINQVDLVMMTMSTKQIYCILAIALNLIEDDIQICDLLRFVHEGYIGPFNVLQYFPENIASNGKELLRNLNYYKNPDKYGDKGFREHIGMFCRNIGILKFKAPDIMKLVRRYVTDLNLPVEVSTYIERLVNIMPPKFNTRSGGVYPHYEARAMAYIIFVLKLLFGLDGDKEQRMSEASKNLNRKIEELNRTSNGKQQLLFVWTEWVQYIEMRKVIVSHFNPTFCEQFNQCQSTTQFLEHMAEEVRRQDEQDNILNETSENHAAKQRLENFKRLFQRFQENFKNTQDDKKKPIHHIEFKPSFTPSSSYFKSICLHFDNENALNSADTYFKIPDFMRTDHTERDIKSYLQVKPLIEYFQKHQKELKTYVLPSNQNCSYVGVFRAPRPLFRGQEHLITRAQKADFDISEVKWAKHIAAEVVYSTDDLEFKTNLDRYERRYFEKRRIALNKNCKLYDASMNYDLSLLRNQANEQNEINTSKDKLPNNNSEYQRNMVNGSGHNELNHSFDLFNETNMNPMPIEEFINCPRRDLDQMNIFDDISDEESVLNEVDDINSPSAAVSLICHEAEASSLEHQPSKPQDEQEFLDIDSEIHIKKEYEEDDSRLNSSRKNDKTPKENSLKLLVSNMDCWMLLGNILMLTKLQKSQLQDKFPRSFSWLLETCAQSLNVDWSAVYEQLLTIELMFCMGIDDPANIKNCIYMNSYNPIKDFQMLVNNYREIW